MAQGSTNETCVSTIGMLPRSSRSTPRGIIVNSIQLSIRTVTVTVMVTVMVTADSRQQMQVDYYSMTTLVIWLRLLRLRTSTAPRFAGYPAAAATAEEQTAVAGVEREEWRARVKSLLCFTGDAQQNKMKILDPIRTSKEQVMRCYGLRGLVDRPGTSTNIKMVLSYV